MTPPSSIVAEMSPEDCNVTDLDISWNVSWQPKIFDIFDSLSGFCSVFLLTIYNTSNVELLRNSAKW